MRPDDLDAVHRLSRQVHVDYPEDLAVFAEKLALFPAGCRVLAQGGEIGGYLFSHPWKLLSAPKLNALFGQLPPRPNCLFLHDIAIDPAWRGRGKADAAMAWFENLSIEMGFRGIGLVAIEGTDQHWSRRGFMWAATFPPAPPLVSYGSGAVYMMKTFPRRSRRLTR